MKIKMYMVVDPNGCDVEGKLLPGNFVHATSEVPRGKGVITYDRSGNAIQVEARLFRFWVELPDDAFAPKVKIEDVNTFTTVAESK